MRGEREKDGESCGGEDLENVGRGNEYEHKILYENQRANKNIKNILTGKGLVQCLVFRKGLVECLPNLYKVSYCKKKKKVMEEIN